MKQGKLIRRAVSAALAGCMMFTLSVPALAESTDALMQLSTAAKSAVSVLGEKNGTLKMQKMESRSAAAASKQSLHPTLVFLQGES